MAARIGRRVEASARLQRISVVAAVATASLALVTTWGEWRAFALVAVTHLLSAALTYCGVASSRARIEVIRQMLADAERQRRELEAAHAETREIEVELRQAQKLEAIGRLASGIAHEINTPAQFVGDGIHFLGESAESLLALVVHYRQACAGATRVDRAAAAAARMEAELDLPWLAEQLPATVERSLAGMRRITSIVQSMREFAHADQKEATPTDLNRALRTTVTIADHEYRHVADVELDLADVPLVTCHPAAVNQVFLDVLVNAAHAIGDAVGITGQRGRIRITTRQDGDDVLVAIADTGTGIPEAIRDRIFDPFFTTKGVGRGTGQGLATARKVVVGHGGTLTFDSEPGRGSTFYLRWPVAMQAKVTAGIAQAA